MRAKKVNVTRNVENLCENLIALNRQLKEFFYTNIYLLTNESTENKNKQK